MAKRTVFTTLTPLPPSVTREAAIAYLHDYEGMIDLNPLVIERHPIRPPVDAESDESRCVWYSLTDKIPVAPGVKQSGGQVTYTCVFNRLPHGLQTHCRAPMGVDIRERWTVAGNPIRPEDPPLRDAEIIGNAGVPPRGLYLREDVELQAHVLVAPFVKKTLKKSHGVLVERLAKKAARAARTAPVATVPPRQSSQPEYSHRNSNARQSEPLHRGPVSQQHQQLTYQEQRRSSSVTNLAVDNRIPYASPALSDSAVPHVRYNNTQPRQQVPPAALQMNRMSLPAARPERFTQTTLPQQSLTPTQQQPQQHQRQSSDIPMTVRKPRLYTPPSLYMRSPVESRGSIQEQQHYGYRNTATPRSQQQQPYRYDNPSQANQQQQTQAQSQLHKDGIPKTMGGAVYNLKDHQLLPGDRHSYIPPKPQPQYHLQSFQQRQSLQNTTSTPSAPPQMIMNREPKIPDVSRASLQPQQEYKPYRPRHTGELRVVNASPVVSKPQPQPQAQEQPKQQRYPAIEPETVTGMPPLPAVIDRDIDDEYVDDLVDSDMDEAFKPQPLKLRRASDLSERSDSVPSMTGSSETTAPSTRHTTPEPAAVASRKPLRLFDPYEEHPDYPVMNPYADDSPVKERSVQEKTAGTGLATGPLVLEKNTVNMGHSVVLSSSEAPRLPEVAQIMDELSPLDGDAKAVHPPSLQPGMAATLSGPWSEDFLFMSS